MATVQNMDHATRFKHKSVSVFFYFFRFPAETRKKVYENNDKTKQSKSYNKF